jgi:hypothetical protein
MLQEVFDVGYWDMYGIRLVLVFDVEIYAGFV